MAGRPTLGGAGNSRVQIAIYYQNHACTSAEHGGTEVAFRWAQERRRSMQGQTDILLHELRRVLVGRK